MIKSKFFVSLLSVSSSSLLSPLLSSLCP